MEDRLVNTCHVKLNCLTLDRHYMSVVPKAVQGHLGRQRTSIEYVLLCKTVLVGPPVIKLLLCCSTWIFIHTMTKQIIDLNADEDIFMFSDEANFHLDGFVSKQNFRYWSSTNLEQFHKRPLHSPKVTVLPTPRPPRPASLRPGPSSRYTVYAPKHDKYRNKI